MNNSLLLEKKLLIPVQIYTSSRILKIQQEHDTLYNFNSQLPVFHNVIILHLGHAYNDMVVQVTSTTGDERCTIRH